MFTTSGPILSFFFSVDSLRDGGALRGGVPAAAGPLHLHVRARLRLRRRHRPLLHALQPAQVLGGRVDHHPIPAWVSLLKCF